VPLAALMGWWTEIGIAYHRQAVNSRMNRREVRSVLVTALFGCFGCGHRPEQTCTYRASMGEKHERRGKICVISWALRTPVDRGHQTFLSPTSLRNIYRYISEGSVEYVVAYPLSILLPHNTVKYSETCHVRKKIVPNFGEGELLLKSQPKSHRLFRRIQPLLHT
jgi:hypothetical protein